MLAYPAPRKTRRRRRRTRCWSRYRIRQPNSAATTLPSSSRPWRTRGRIATAPSAPGQQEQPVERQQSAARRSGSVRRGGSEKAAASRRSTIRCRTERTAAARTGPRPGCGNPASACRSVGCAASGGAVYELSGVDRRENRRDHRHEDQNAGHAIGIKCAGHQQRRRQTAQAVPDSAAIYRAGGVRLVVRGRWRGNSAIFSRPAPDSERQQPGHPPPGGKRRRHQRQVSQRDAGKRAGEYQQEG